LHRLTHSKPRVEAFFKWVDEQFDRQGLLPSSPLTTALHYAHERREGLEIYLDDPETSQACDVSGNPQQPVMRRGRSAAGTFARLNRAALRITGCPVTRGSQARPSAADRLSIAAAFRA
jgi:hypothetical protein